MAKNWISGAIKHPGSLTAQAQAAGKSIQEFCSGKDLDSKTKKRCVLANTLRSFKKN